MLLQCCLLEDVSVVNLKHNPVSFENTLAHVRVSVAKSSYLIIFISKFS